VYERVSSIISKVIEECMQFLRVVTFLPSSDNSFYALSAIRSTVKSNISISNRTGKVLLSCQEAIKRYTPWLKDFLHPVLYYDIFVSYRWNDFDTNLAGALFDKTASDVVTVSRNNRAVHVFLDRNRLKNGLNFVDSFSKSLINSTVVVPLISTKALERMFSHDPATRDNVLLEWLITLECVSAGKIEKVFPILVGSTDADGNVAADFFASVKLDLLPDVVPVETLRYSILLCHFYFCKLFHFSYLRCNFYFLGSRLIF
jgi:hypothetical protein